MLGSGDPSKIFDAAITNKWNWPWLSQKDCNNDFLSEYHVKIDKSVYAWCTWCNEQSVYGSGGKKDLMKHCTKKKHLEHLNTRKENTALPASWLEQNPDPGVFAILLIFYMVRPQTFMIQIALPGIIQSQ